VLIDRTHKKWAVFTVAATVLSIALYVWHVVALKQYAQKDPSGSTWFGLAYGFLALGLISFCCLLGLRKKVRIWRIGRAQTWMRAHIWLGLLTVPLVLGHGGLNFGNNLTLAIMLLFATVILSGVLGLLLQNLVPTVMMERLPAEATFEQIHHVFELLRGEADEMITASCGSLEEGGAAPAAILAAPAPKRATVLVKKEGGLQGKAPAANRAKSATPLEGSEPLKVFYVKDVRPFLASGSLRGQRLTSAQNSSVIFEHTRSLTPPALHETLKDLESICEERRQLALQLKLHGLLHGWLFVHAPLSYLLLVLVLVHAIVSTLRY